MLKINPWVKIWTAPRATIQAIKEHNPKHGLVYLSFIYGFLWMLAMCQTLSIGHYYGVAGITVASVILAIPLGYLFISLSSLFFFWTGKMFNGKASYSEVRAAVAWPNALSIVTIITWAIMMANYGSLLFMADNGTLEPSFGLPDIIFIIQAIVAVWSIVVLVIGVSQVQGFSGWRAFANFLVVLVIWCLITLGAMYLIAYQAQPAATAVIHTF